MRKITEADKTAKILRLVQKRRMSTPEGFLGLGDVQGGAHECDFVSPFTKSCNNVNAGIMFFLQDWVSTDRLEGNQVDPEILKRGHDPNLVTNKNLKWLLRNTLNAELSDTYGTNLFPFVKEGNMSAQISSRNYRLAAKEYAIPQIEAVQPRILILCGAKPGKYIMEELGLHYPGTLGVAINRSPYLHGEMQVWVQAHPGGQGSAQRGGIDQLRNDWGRMADAMTARN